MKTTLLAAAAAIAALGFAAQADAATISINGSVAPACSFNMANSAVTISTDLAGSDGKLNTAAISGLNLGSASNVWCNGANAKLSIEAQPLMNSAVTAPEGFTNRVDYTANFDDGFFFMADVSRNAGATDNSYGIHSSATLSGTTGYDSEVDNDKLLVAGTYTGQVIVTMAPGV
jgi:hypothetical protein